MTHDRRPLYVLLAGVVGLLSGPALLGLVSHELLWAGLLAAPVRIDLIWLWLFSFCVAGIAACVMASALWPDRRRPPHEGE